MIIITLKSIKNTRTLLFTEISFLVAVIAHIALFREQANDKYNFVWGKSDMVQIKKIMFSTHLGDIQSVNYKVS